MKSERILIIGSNGQIGSVLAEFLRGIYSESNVIGADLSKPENVKGPFEILDATDRQAVFGVFKKYKISQVYHLAAILSAKGEQQPLITWQVNMQTYFNVLEASREYGVKKVFYPSSIAVFGAGIHGEAKQSSYLDPGTVYGISKVAGENWSNYYFRKYGIDIRSLRYPGIIGYQSMPGGGTTDYAVDIYHKAVKGEHFECFLKPDTTLPMIYIADALDASVRLMEAPADRITIRTGYNLAGMSFSPDEVIRSIRKLIPGFEVTYLPDFRQEIAASWPQTVDDSQARKDWGWRPSYNLEKMTKEMILELRKKYDLVEN
ncbi:putative epimerase/dehydratase [Dyadobacter sp. CECT 9275]|uniref:Epimerase/dehydratase n=1 Tax=Dyadobacter helix TaxID=2822344 RepID=A0A916N5X8_9BACT|nr:NAD-dependent epimerase/dehydratase family protein [Dyadobacter sp. CECT 9275]CAG5007375.1 putative epimerase/dehydratase [Dyadobacter sp. CECT 9275]